MARVRLDAVAAGAVDQAREAAVAVGGAVAVGEHLQARAEGDRLVTHTFACRARGYPGWQWTVTLARAPRARAATVCEVELMATAEAVTAPSWVPWVERVAPGDLGPGDLLPQPEGDDRLESGFAVTGEEDVDQVAVWELGLGRRRVLSREGRLEACARWQEGDFGPTSTMARQAPEKCRQCGFLMPLAGSLRQNFGVCTNEWSPADGRVISLDYGCGAHSEQPPPPPLSQAPAPVVDDLRIDLITLPHEPDHAPAPTQETQQEGQDTHAPAPADDRPADEQPADDRPGAGARPGGAEEQAPAQPPR